MDDVCRFLIDMLFCLQRYIFFLNLANMNTKKAFFYSNACVYEIKVVLLQRIKSSPASGPPASELYNMFIFKILIVWQSK